MEEHQLSEEQRRLADKQKNKRITIQEIICTIILYILFLLSAAFVFYLINHGGGEILWKMLYGF